ncbi:O-antigen ligase family protein [Halorubrum ezzemoulense]|uniref:O-antigen ligase family protein n=1 Tax=Halorubrum TaxID=56688 RepID=UPI0010F56064|nr:MULTISPECIES: O-antigen ligase family protein [Halorubrum]MDB2253509.1 O-antigen ligase family protein [Halorubrum ezzemoulense]TKX63964.1 O-antigen ligase family protein [Halorubrum sp. GN12_10-3_MGM]
MEVTERSRRQQIETIFPLVLLLFLFCSLILQNTTISSASAYIVIATVYTVISLYFLVYVTQIDVTNRSYIALFLLFSSFVLFRTLLDPVLGDVVRLLALLTFTTANLIIFPQVFTFRQFCFVGSRLGAFLVVIGSLPYFGYTVSIGFVNISLWGSQLYWYPSLQPMMSVFVNPNQLGSFALFGTIASLYEWKTDRSSLITVILVLNLLGLAFSNYRTGWIALLAALAIYVVHTKLGREFMTLAVISGFSSLLIAFLMMFNVFPGPEFLTEVSLNNRRELWTTSILSLQERPLFGYNFTGVVDIVGNPHNSYLRMFSAFGLFGGCLYSILSLGIPISATRQTTTDSQVILAMLLVSFVFVQIFNSLSFVGVAMRSSIIALLMGYFITATYLN